MSTLLRRTMSAVATGAITVVLALSSATAGHARPPVVDHVNLGDSYSAGFGTGGITEVAAECLQGAGPDHVSRLDQHPRVRQLVNAACGGATSAQITAAVEDNGALQIVLDKADLVTMTLGGNDVPWTTIVALCSTLGPGQGALCGPLLLQTAQTLPAVGASVGEAVAAVDEATDGRVIVLGYPRLFDPAGVSGPTGVLVSAENAALLNGATDLLNATIAAAAQANGATFVGVADRFEGHGLGSADPWIALDLATLLQDQPTPAVLDNLHPTSEGYLKGYYPALQRAIDAGTPGR